MVPTPIVCRLTGLSTVKLREWTSRRALIPADIPAPKRGAPALYSWQTVMVLRLAIVMRDAFHVELKAHEMLFERLRSGLRDRPFAALRGTSLIITGDGGWRIEDRATPFSEGADCLVLGLDAHLNEIGGAFDFALPAGIPRKVAS